MSIWLTERYFCKDSSAIDRVNFLRKKHYLFDSIYRADNFDARKIIIERDYNLLKITISSAGIFSTVTFYNLLKIVCFIAAIFVINYFKNNFLFQRFFTKTILLPIQVFLYITIAFFSFCLLILLFKLLLDIFGKMKVTIDDKHLAIACSLFGIENHKSQTIDVKSIICLEKHDFPFPDNSYLEIITERQNCIISNNPHFLVTSSEIDFIGETISNWLNISLVEIRDLTQEELKKAICDARQLSYTLERQDYRDSTQKGDI